MKSDERSLEADASAGLTPNERDALAIIAEQNSARIKKNYEEFLKTAKETLADCPYLTPTDGANIEGGAMHLELGFALLKSDDPKVLRDAAGILMCGAFYVGSYCSVPAIGKKHWDIIVRGPGGKKGTAEKVKNKEEWHAQASEDALRIYGDKPKLTVITKIVIAQKAKKIRYLEYRTVYDFLRGLLQPIKKEAR